MYVVFAVLAVCGSAMFGGVMLAIGLILGNFWLSLTGEQFLTWFKINSHYIASALPWVVLPTAVGHVGVLRFAWDQGAQIRGLWLAAAACIAAVLIFTAVWFLPKNAAFVAGQVPAEQAHEQVQLWLRLHLLRMLLAVTAAVLGATALGMRRGL